MRYQRFPRADEGVTVMEYEIKETTSLTISLGDGYYLTGIMNATNSKRSWWISKEFFVRSNYCFSTFAYGTPMKKELEYQLKEIQQHKDLFAKMFVSAGKKG